nr:movement protein [blackberry line pattern virus]
MKKFFSTRSSKSARVPTLNAPPAPVQVNQEKRSSKDTQVDKNEMVAEASLHTAKRQLYKFDLPSADQGFDGLCKEYTEGSRFQYVALSGKSEETLPARVRRLVTLAPKINRNVLPVHKVPILRLINDTEQFNLSLVISKKGPAYIRLASATAIYAPEVSALSEFTTVIMSLHDSRRLTNTCVQSAKFNSNISQKIELSLDYCIRRESAHKITFNVSREQKFLEDDEEWAAVQVQIKLEESDFPYPSNLKEATAIMALPESVLASHSVNPNHIDTTITETQRRKVREMYESGDIADENEPLVEELTDVKYAASSHIPKKKGPRKDVHAGAGWEGFQFRKGLIPKDQQSIEPEEDDESDRSIPISPPKKPGFERGEASKGVTFSTFDV